MALGDRRSKKVDVEATRPGRRTLLGWVVAMATAVLGFGVTWALGVTFFDFDLHYLAAKLERSGGSFVDTAQVQAMADQAGRDIDPLGVFGTPALIALVYVPLSLLSLDTAHVMWVVLSVAMITMAVWRAAGTSPYWPAFVAAATFGGALVHSLALGNASTLTFACIVYAFGALLHDKRNQAGVALGLAIAFKAYPAFLLAPLLLSKRTHEIVAALLTCVATYAATFMILGPSDFVAGMQRLFDVGGGVLDRAENSGLPGLVVAATGNASLAGWVSRLAMVGAIGAVFLLRKRMPVGALFAVSALLMLLSQAIAWRHYFAIALIGLVLMLEQRYIFTRNWRIAAVGFFLAATGYQQWLIGNTTANAGLVNSIYVIGTLGLAALIVLGFQRTPAKEHVE